MNTNEKQPATPSRRDFLNRAALGAATLGAVALARPTFAQTPASPAPEPAPAPAAEAPKATESPKEEAPKEEAPKEEAPKEEAEKPVTAPGDLEILNFALGLERLEATFYAQILGAQEKRAYLSPKLFESARDIGAIEIFHVTTLENAILSAGGTLAPNATYRFPANVFLSPVAFSWFGYTLEEIGIGAYLGAVGQIQDKALRAAAASIYGSEVRHAAILRSLGGFTFSPRYFESPLSVEQVQTLVAPYIS